MLKIKNQIYNDLNLKPYKLIIFNPLMKKGTKLLLAGMFTLEAIISGCTTHNYYINLSNPTKTNKQARQSKCIITAKQDDTIISYWRIFGKRLGYDYVNGYSDFLKKFVSINRNDLLRKNNDWLLMKNYNYQLPPRIE